MQWTLLLDLMKNACMMFHSFCVMNASRRAISSGMDLCTHGRMAHSERPFTSNVIDLTVIICFAKWWCVDLSTKWPSNADYHFIQVSIWLAVLGKWNDDDEHFYNLLIEIFIPLKQKSLQNAACGFVKLLLMNEFINIKLFTWDIFSRNRISHLSRMKLLLKITVYNIEKALNKSESGLLFFGLYDT